MNRISFPFLSLLWLHVHHVWRCPSFAVSNRCMLAISLLSATSLAQTTDLTCEEGYIQDDTTGTCTALTQESEDDFYDEEEGDDEFDDEYNTFEEDEYAVDEQSDALDDNVMDDEEDEDEEIITETVEQEVSGTPEEIAATEQVLKTMLNYVEEELSKQKYDKVRSICINKDKLCAFWASMDECETSASYMKVDCALACQSCDLLDVKSRCPLDPNAVDIWKPGDLNHMFQRIAYGPESSSRKIQVLSEPSFENKSENDYGPLPWVVVLDDFISDAECERLIELGYKLGYKRSKDVGDELPDGTFDAVVSQDRTSTNAWCDESCFEDEMTQGVLKKIENLTGIPADHSEDLQLLKYKEGQFYSTHHDFIEYQVDRPCGPRILTAFLYLNDVEAGGGTNFPELNVTVMPKKGRILLWPSVLDQDPISTDRWTLHQALPVEKGVKYAANGWLHLREYKSVHDAGCD